MWVILAIGNMFQKSKAQPPVLRGLENQGRISRKQEISHQHKAEAKSLELKLKVKNGLSDDKSIAAFSRACSISPAKGKATVRIHGPIFLSPGIMALSSSFHDSATAQLSAPVSNLVSQIPWTHPLCVSGAFSCQLVSTRFMVSSLKAESSKVEGPLNSLMSHQTYRRLSMRVGEVAPDGEGNDCRHRAPGTPFRDSPPFTGHGWSQPQTLSVSLLHTHDLHKSWIWCHGIQAIMLHGKISSCPWLLHITMFSSYE